MNCLSPRLTRLGQEVPVSGTFDMSDKDWLLLLLLLLFWPVITALDIVVS